MWFFLYYGEKLVSRSVGRVADFCCICGDLTACDFREHRFSGHVYGFAIGRKGLVVGHTAGCERCGACWASDPDRFDGDPAAGVPDLHAHTRVLIDPVLAGRLALERRVGEQLDDADKAGLAFEYFDVLAPGPPPTLRVGAAIDRLVPHLGGALQRLRLSRDELRALTRLAWRRGNWLGEELRDDDDRYEAMASIAVGLSRVAPENLRLLLARLDRDGPDDSRRRLLELSLPYAIARLGGLGAA